MIQTVSLAALPQAMNQADRILLCLWLVFLLMVLMMLMGFYGWTFFAIGVQSDSSLSAYIVLAVLTILLLAALAVGMLNLRCNNVEDTKGFVLAYNIALCLVLLFTMGLTMLFAQHVSRAELVHFLAKPHMGSATFLEYLHNKFNCCVLTSPDELASSTYTMLNTDVISTSTLKPEIGMSLCPNETVNKGCLDHISSLTELLGKDREAYAVHMLQTFLPVILLVGVFVLMLLFNSYVTYGKDDDDYRTRARAPLPHFPCPRHDELASVFCAGFALQAGTILPPLHKHNPLSPTAPPLYQTKTDYIPLPSLKI